MRISNAAFTALCNRQLAAYAAFRAKPSPANEMAVWEANRAIRDTFKIEDDPDDD